MDQGYITAWGAHKCVKGCVIVLLRHITRATACAQHHYWPTQELLQARSQARRYISLQGFCGISHRHRQSPKSTVGQSVTEHTDTLSRKGFGALQCAGKTWHATGEHPLQVRWMSHLGRDWEWICPAFGDPGMSLLHKNCRTLPNQGDVAYTSEML